MSKLDKLIKMIDKKSTIEHSAYFDAGWYAKRYGIESNESAEHYLKYGYRHGFDPSLNFSTREYLANNPDVKMNPLLHYELYGKYEHRLGVRELASNKGVFINLNEVKDLIDKADIVSFDIFDSLIVRPFSKADGIYDYIEKSLDLDNFAYIRKCAELSARKKYELDVSIDQIYELMPERFKDIRDIELECELKLDRRNEQIMDVYNYCLEKGKEVICISDMYLDEEFEKKLLKSCGFEIDKVYCSCGRIESKANGLLFKEVKSIYSDKQILHIGDNVLSDYRNAKDNGLEAFLISRNDEIIDCSLDYSYLSDLDKSNIGYIVHRGILGNNYYGFRNNNADYKFGYGLGGPFVLSYVQYICDKAKENGVDCLGFVARDGYVLKRVYDEFFKERYGFRSAYLYATRACGLGALMDYQGEAVYLSKLLKLAKSDGVDVDDSKDNVSEFNSKYDVLSKWSKRNYENLKRHFVSECGDCKSIMVIDLNTKHFSSLKLCERMLDVKVMGMFSSVFANDCDCVYEVFARRNISTGFKDAASIMEILVSAPSDSIVGVNDDLSPRYERDCSKDNYNDIMSGIIDYVSDFVEIFGLGSKLMLSYDEWILMCQNYIDRCADAGNRILKHMENSI